jgi:hypothetical protein
LLFVAGIITFAAGGNNTTGFLFTTTGFLFLALGIGARRKEDAKAEDEKDEKTEEEKTDSENE